MSLKVFHIVFVTLSIALALGCGVWAVQSYVSVPATEYLIGIVLSLIGAVLLILYLMRIIRKFKSLRGMQNTPTEH